MILFLLIAFWVASGILGAWVAGQKGREPIEGFVLGLFFGPIGAVIEALLPMGKWRPPAVEDDEDDPPPAWLDRPGGLELPAEPPKRRKADEPPPGIRGLKL